jgi:hypothetical protein
MFRRFGSEITILEHSDRLTPHEDEDVSTAIREILEAERVDVRVSTKLVGLSKRGDEIVARLDSPAGPSEITGSHLLFAVGRRPNTDDLGLEKTGIIADDHGYIAVDDQLRSTVPGIWALGDCNGRGAFTHTSYNDFEIVAANLSREAILMTDEARHYVKIGEGFAGHGHTNHAAGEYVSRFNPLVHTNTVEGSFSIFKRGMRGVYQHCKEKNLHRYLAEFEFRYNTRKITDGERAVLAVRGGDGKLHVRRLMREIHVFGEHAELGVRHLNEGLCGQIARQGKGEEQAGTQAHRDRGSSISTDPSKSVVRPTRPRRTTACRRVSTSGTIVFGLSHGTLSSRASSSGQGSSGRLSTDMM